MLRLFVCFLSLLVVGDARPRRVVSKTIPDHFRALALDKQKLTGLLGSRVRANSEGFLENLDLQALLNPILNGVHDPETAAEREFPGRFLDAAADAFEYNHDLQLRTQMDKVADALASMATASLPKPGTSLTEPDLLIARCDLLGLLAYYRVTSEPSAYATALALGNVVVKQLAMGANGRSINHLSNPASGQDSKAEPFASAKAGLIEPLVRLYRLSGDKKYLDLCTLFAHSPTTTQIDPQTSQENLASTFSALTGFADLYEVTGDATYLRPAVEAWKRVASTRLSLVGAPLPPRDSASETDSCTASGWMQFTFKLLRVTGDSVYGDGLEKTIYNQILASQDVRDGRLSAAVPLSGLKLFPAKLQGQSGRCLLSEAKALALLPQLVWGRYESGIAINLYTAGRAFFPLEKHGVVQIYSEGAYPETGQLQLHVEPSRKGPAQFPLRLRVPSWASDFTVDVAGTHLVGRAGEVVVVDRAWKSGDTVRVSMAMTIRAASLLGATEEKAILQRGPQVLTLAQSLNAGIGDLGNAFLRPLKTGGYQLSNYDDKLPRDFTGTQVYRIAGTVLGKPQDLLLTPFADANNYRTSFRKLPD